MKKSIRLLGIVAILCSIAQGQQKTVTTKDGTLNYVPKFSGPTTLVNSALFEVGGRVGIGTKSPTQKLTVDGLVYSTIGGFKFPDGTILSTAHAMNGLTKIFHDTSLTGSATSASPLGIAAPLTLTISIDASALTLSSQAIGGHGLTATGGPNATGGHIQWRTWHRNLRRRRCGRSVWWLGFLGRSGDLRNRWLGQRLLGRLWHYCVRWS